MSDKTNNKKCRFSEKCGGCAYQGLAYKKQLEKKQRYIESLLKDYGKVSPIIGMKNPLHYRNKVHRALTKDRSGNIISGPYEEGSHWIINVDRCAIEDEKSQEIIDSIKVICKKLNVPIYNEKNGNGIMRRILIRRGFKTGEIMVVLVVGSKKFISKHKFARLLAEAHPEITTIISNLNDKRTSMILGDKEEILFGPGFITDELCGLKFRISSDSFYQVNPAQTEVIYQTAMDFANLKGKETVIDAYCGIGTIGMVASKQAGNVIGVELNPDAVRDAKVNEQINNIKNTRFVHADAGDFMKRMASGGKKADVVFMDPPRNGSTIAFMRAAVKLSPEKIIYISCGPESLARNLKFFVESGYRAEKIQPVDNFPFTKHIETIVSLAKVNG